MKSRVTIWALILVATLSTTSCAALVPEAAAPSQSASQTESQRETSAPSTPETSAPGDGASTSDQSLAEACTSVEQQLAGVAAQFQDFDPSTVMADPQVVLDAYDQAITILDDVKATVSQPEVSAALTSIGEDFVRMRELISEVAVDGNFQNLAELSTVASTMQQTILDLQSTCTDALYG